jgi:hypothetical protein
MNINVTLGDDSTIYCNVQLITPIVNIEMTGIKGETGSIPGAGIPVSSGAAWDTSLTATVESTFILSGPSPFAWAKKTLAQVKTILGLVQDLTTDASPTFANITDSGLTASQAVFTDANKKLVSNDSPTFANITDSGLTASQTVFSDANKKLISKSAADTMAALVGSFTANYKCFVNSSGNGTEWAKGIKVVSTTRDSAAASGAVAITSVGFKPSSVFALLVLTAGGESSIGFSDGTTSRCITTLYTAIGKYVPVSFLAQYSPLGGTGDMTVAVQSFDSDGVTLYFTKNSSPTGTVQIDLFFIR